MILRRSEAAKLLPESIARAPKWKKWFLLSADGTRNLGGFRLKREAEAHERHVVRFKKNPVAKGAPFGQTLIAYHCGHPLIGGKFDAKYLGTGEGFDLPPLGPGFYFSDKVEAARAYCKYAEDPMIYTVRLNMNDVLWQSAPTNRKQRRFLDGIGSNYATVFVGGFGTNEKATVRPLRQVSSIQAAFPVAEARRIADRFNQEGSALAQRIWDIQDEEMALSKAGVKGSDPRREALEDERIALQNQQRKLMSSTKGMGAQQANATLIRNGIKGAATYLGVRIGGELALEIAIYDPKHIEILSAEPASQWVELGWRNNPKPTKMQRKRQRMRNPSEYLAQNPDCDEIWVVVQVSASDYDRPIYAMDFAPSLARAKTIAKSPRFTFMTSPIAIFHVKKNRSGGYSSERVFEIRDEEWGDYFPVDFELPIDPRLNPEDPPPKPQRRTVARGTVHPRLSQTVARRRKLLRELKAKYRKENPERLVGGLADGMDPDKFDPDDLIAGIEVEMEHTHDPCEAMEIAMDHLKEHEDYYEALEEMEEALEAQKLAANPRKELYIYPNKSAIKAAERGLRAREKAPKSKKGGLDAMQAAEQGIGSGVLRARDIIAGKRVNAYQVKAFFDRHRGNYVKAKADGKRAEESKAIQAWLIWGGDPLYRQATRAVEAHRAGRKVPYQDKPKKNPAPRRRGRKPFTYTDEWRRRITRIDGWETTNPPQWDEWIKEIDGEKWAMGWEDVSSPFYGEDRVYEIGFGRAEGPWNPTTFLVRRPYEAETLPMHELLALAEAEIKKRRKNPRKKKPKRKTSVKTKVKRGAKKVEDEAREIASTKSGRTGIGAVAGAAVLGVPGAIAGAVIGSKSKGPRKRQKRRRNPLVDVSETEFSPYPSIGERFGDWEVVESLDSKPNRYQEGDSDVDMRSIELRDESGNALHVEEGVHRLPGDAEIYSPYSQYTAFASFVPPGRRANLEAWWKFPIAQAPSTRQMLRSISDWTEGRRPEYPPATADAVLRVVGNPAKPFRSRDHDWGQVLISHDGKRMTRRQILNYYKRNKAKIWPFLEGQTVMVMIAPKQNDFVLRRKGPDGTYIKLTKLDGIDDPRSFEYWIHRRAIEFHPVLMKTTTPLIWVDIDPNPGRGKGGDAKSLNRKARRAIPIIEGVLRDEFGVRDVHVWHSGKRGYHVEACPPRAINVDKVRTRLRTALDDAFEGDPTFTTSVPKPGQIRLDTTGIKTMGSIRAPYSLAVTGRPKKPARR